ncbi:MAG: hypothetical protein MI865_04220, partial [Proteobacteria bacterium]|nr:hypothetical protein [Pseudomonadota bacterium]
EYCEKVTIHDESDFGNCLGLSFETEKFGDRVFEFIAEFDGRDSLEYTWYINGDSIKTEPLGGERSHRIEREFEDGIHSICIVAETEECGVVEYCEEIFAGERDCPALHFEVEENDDGTLTFIADFDGKEDLQYKWYLNDDTVDIENFDGVLTDHKLDLDLEPGYYYVCISAEVDGCEEVFFCEKIIIEGECVEELSYEVEEEGPNGLLFFANFEGKEHTRYKWYINDEIVDYENFEDHETDHKLWWEFGPGEYHVCIVSYTDGCESVEYCETFSFEGFCPEELFFNKEADGDNAYLFTADFEGRNDIPYKWYINDDIVDQENFDNHETDHKLFWDFEPGSYIVCIVTYTDYCEEVEYCEEIVVDQFCPNELFFHSEEEGDSVYVFESDFEGMERVKYKWYIGDEIVDMENYDSQDTDHKLVWAFEPGEYNVCIVLTEEDCDDIEYCETIVVEEESPNCITDISFDGVVNSTNDGYIFEADFDGRDNVTYIWSISVDGDVLATEVHDAGDTNHLFDWDFETDVVYEV